MVSNLAAQLAKTASLNSAVLADRSRRKPTQSYLFSSKEADQHDFDSIHALGMNGFTQLAALNSEFREYEAKLFSDAAKAFDRTLQPAEVVAELDRTLESFLPLLGPYLLESPTGKVIEWLVRRFRIQELNVNSVVVLFLPYHDAPHFAKMLSILRIEDNSIFSPLLPFKTTAIPLTRSALVNIILQPHHSDFARFVAGILPSHLRQDAIPGLHRGLIAFHTSVLLEFIKKNHDLRKGNVPDESILAWYLPAALEPLQICAGIKVEPSKEALVKETILAAFLLLSALSHCCPLSTEALSAILKLVATCSPRVSSKHLMRTFVSLCAAQDCVTTEIFSDSLINNILTVPHLEQEIKESLPYSGSEYFIGAFVSALVARPLNEEAFKIVDSLVTHSELPVALTRSITTSLFQTLLHTNGEASTDLGLRIRSLLVQVQQRHPDILQGSFEDILQASPEKKEMLEQALLSLSIDLPGAIQKLDSIVGSMSAESAVRVISVRELFEKLRISDSEENSSIRSALLTRVQDTSASVLEALYANSDQLLPIILESPFIYLDNVSHALHASASSRHVVKAHISFIARHFYSAILSRQDSSKLASGLFNDILLPFLLYSKPRQKTASAVWEILAKTEKLNDETFGIARYELLAGCVDAMKWETGEEGEGRRNAKTLAKVNTAVAARVADNIISSNVFDEHVTSFLSRFRDEDTHSRALGFLVIRSLLSKTSGEQQLDIALRALTSMGIESLDNMGDFLKGAENVHEVADDTNLGNALFQKPSSRNTLHRLQASIIIMLPNVPRPGLSLNWLDDATRVDRKAAKYMRLIQTIYKYANTNVFPPALCGYLLRVILINLGEDALQFLASIWLSSDLKVNAEPAHYVALHHAAAFLEAHYATQRCIDFQTVLPAILSALRHCDRRIRGSALECIRVLVRLSQMKKPISVYAYDAMYGAGSDALQYLDWADLWRYVQALGDAHEHMLNDASYLNVFHQQHLAVTKWESKKEAGYKKRILCYISSHISACRQRSLKVSLLQSVADLSSPIKSRMLSSTIQSVVDEKTASNIISQFGALYEDYAVLLVSSFDASAAENLNEVEGPFWTVYQQVLRYFFRSSSVTNARKALSHRLQHGLFAALSFERKVELSQMLLDLGQSDSDMSKACRDILVNVLSDVTVIVRVLRTLQPDAIEAEQRAPKRARVDGHENASKEKISSLNAFADVLAASQLPGSLELITAILDTLTKLVHDVPTVSGDKVFAEQLLLSALEGSTSNMPEGTKLSATAIRLDILVELIRASENPQTFNQALLLMASLARLAPDAVLLNIMPIFTFMGSNVFHRDDSYSFRVVQKTIDSIVPVMVSSLRASHSVRSDLYIASRPFLRIFTDAANHIPRHRRPGFFAQLVDALGPQDFLAPICMLLVDKVANRVVRQNLTDARNSLTLPLTLIQRYTLEQQLSALDEVLQEAHRLADADSNPSGGNSTFLDMSDDERADTSMTVQRQGQALLAFVQHAVAALPSVPLVESAPEHPYSSKLLSSALNLAISRQRGEFNHAIADAAQSVVNSILGSMTAGDFVNGVYIVLQTGDIVVQQGALELLGDHLPEVKDTARLKVSKVVIKIIDSIKKSLLSKTDEPLIVASLHALKAVSITMCPGEESALTALVPVVITYIQGNISLAPSLDVLSSLVVKLGPRIIPYFKDIVVVNVNVLRSEQHSLQTIITSLDTLQALLSSIPKFWGKIELTQVFNVYLDSSSSAARTHVPQMVVLIKAIAKKAPAKVLLPLLCELWPEVGSADERSEDRLLAYWRILKRTIRAAARPMISEHLRPLFKTFLDAFQLFTSKPSLQENILPAAISTFLALVVKINEASFKPLFRKLYDWAFNTSDPFGHEKQLVFCHIYSALLDYFKGLMVAYMTLLLQPLTSLLEAFRQDSNVSNVKALWSATLRTITKTFTHDDGGVFWRDDKLRQLLVPLVAQIVVSSRFNDDESKNTVSECLLGMADVISDDSLLKSLNIDILMNARSEDSRVRLQALACSRALWKSHGGKMLGFVSETVTFIAEAAEDENDDVVREALRLKDAIESVAGRIDV